MSKLLEYLNKLITCKKYETGCQAAFILTIPIDKVTEVEHSTVQKKTFSYYNSIQYTKQSIRIHNYDTFKVFDNNSYQYQSVLMDVFFENQSSTTRTSLKTTGETHALGMLPRNSKWPRGNSILLNSPGYPICRLCSCKTLKLKFYLFFKLIYYIFQFLWPELRTTS